MNFVWLIIVIQGVTPIIVMLSVIKMIISMLSAFVLNVIMLSDINKFIVILIIIKTIIVMQSAAVLNVIMLSAVICHCHADHS